MRQFWQRFYKTVFWTIALATSLLVCGCAAQTRYHSSAVEFLYPGDSAPVEKISIPVLTPPLKVGIAFVPDNNITRTRSWWQEMVRGSTATAGMVLTEKQKVDLMQEIVGYFKKYPFVDGIEIIPSGNLIPGGSFHNLDQIRSLYQVDVIALLAYDQVQFTDEGKAAFLYWTIVGAYLVPAERNTTHTIMDAVVYDIKSRKMLFRAPGVSKVTGRSTPVNLSEELRVDSEQGFKESAAQLVQNLDQQLAQFREKLKESQKSIK